MSRIVSIPKMRLRTVSPSRGPFRLVASKYYTFEILAGSRLIGWTMETHNVGREEALANARVFVEAMRAMRASSPKKRAKGGGTK